MADQVIEALEAAECKTSAGGYHHFFFTLPVHASNQIAKMDKHERIALSKKVNIDSLNLHDENNAPVKYQSHFLDFDRGVLELKPNKRSYN